MDSGLFFGLFLAGGSHPPRVKKAVLLARNPQYESPKDLLETLSTSGDCATKRAVLALSNAPRRRSEKRGTLMPNLYDLKEQLWEAVTDAQEGEDGEWLGAMSEFLEGEIEDKLDSVACVVKQMLADEAQLAAAAQELSARRASVKNKIRKLKEYAADMIHGLPTVSINKAGVPVYPKFKKNLFTTRIQRENKAWDHDKTDLDLIVDESLFRMEKLPLYTEAMKLHKATGEIPAGFDLKEEKWGLRIQ